MDLNICMEAKKGHNSLIFFLLNTKLKIDQYFKFTLKYIYYNILVYNIIFHFKNIYFIKNKNKN